MNAAGMQRTGCVPAAVSLSAVLGQQDMLGVGGQRGTELSGIGDYVFDRTVGEGQFGKVKVATHKLSGMRVAIKIINKLKLTADTLRMVHREVAIMKMLRHPNIIRLYEVIDTPALLFLVMEYAPGGEVMDLIATHGRLKEGDAVRFFAQTAYALAYCHSRRTVHRDVKAENLLLDAHMNVKLIDFGLSNVYDPRDVLKTFCGSPTYASPELVQRRAYTGPEVDCWSLGVLLYVLVVGELPFLGKSYLELYRKIIAARYWMPSFLSPDCQDLIRHMLVPDIKSRATITEICNHPWVRAGGVSIPRQNFGLAPPPPDADDLDPAVLDQMEDMGFDRQAVVDSVIGDLYDDAAATYCLLASNARARSADDSADDRTPTTPLLSADAHPGKSAAAAFRGSEKQHQHQDAAATTTTERSRGLTPAAAAFAAPHGVPAITRSSADGDVPGNHDRDFAVPHCDTPLPQLPQKAGKGSPRDSSSGNHETAAAAAAAAAEEREAQRRQRRRKRTSLCVVEPLTGTPTSSCSPQMRGAAVPSTGTGTGTGTNGGRRSGSPGPEAEATLGSPASSPGKKGHSHSRAHGDSRSSGSSGSSDSDSSGHGAGAMRKSSSAGVLSTKRRPLAGPEGARSERQAVSPPAGPQPAPAQHAHHRPAHDRPHGHHGHHGRHHHHHHHDREREHDHGERAPHREHSRRHHASRTPSLSPEKTSPRVASSSSSSVSNGSSSTGNDDDGAVRLPVAAPRPRPSLAATAPPTAGSGTGSTRAETESDTWSSASSASSSSGSAPGSGRTDPMPSPQRHTRLGMLVNWRRTVAESQPDGAAQTPRPVRFAFSVSATTALPAEAIVAALRAALRRHRELAVAAERPFVLRCTEQRAGAAAAGTASTSGDGHSSDSSSSDTEDDDALVMEAEVCQLPLLSQNGVRFRRIAGDAARYKALCKELTAALELHSTE